MFRPCDRLRAAQAACSRSALVRSAEQRLPRTGPRWIVTPLASLTTLGQRYPQAGHHRPSSRQLEQVTRATHQAPEATSQPLRSADSVEQAMDAPGQPRTMLGRPEGHTAAPTARACLESPANDFRAKSVHTRLALRCTAVDTRQRQAGATGAWAGGSPRRGAKLGSMGHRTVGRLVGRVRDGRLRGAALSMHCLRI